MINTCASPENQPEDTRTRIIAAAIKLFGQVGYSQATTREIARAAGVNEVTLFRHFGSKKNLLMASIKTFNASGFAPTFESELTGNYAVDILIMARLQMQDTTVNLETLRLILCDARYLPELQEAILTGGRANLERLSCYFQRQIDAGIVRSDIPAQVLANAFDSLFSSNILFEGLTQDVLSPQLSVQEVIHPLVDFFVSGSQAAPERSI